MLTSRWSFFVPKALTRRRGLFLALLAVEACLLAGLAIAFAVGLGSRDDELVAAETLLDERDLPAGWSPITAVAYPYMSNSPLITMLMEEETVAGAFAAYRDPQDSRAVATYVVFRPDEPLRIEFGTDGTDLDAIAPIVLEAERLAREHLGGGSPELFFAASDAPTPGAVRGRSLAPPTGEGVQSDFVLFTEGPALALVVVEHPKGEEPFRPVEELAQLVHGRIQEQLR